MTIRRATASNYHNERAAGAKNLNSCRCSKGECNDLARRRREKNEVLECQTDEFKCNLECQVEVKIYVSDTQLQR